MLNRMVQTTPIVKAVEVSVPLPLNGMRTWFHNSASDANIVLYIVTFMEKLNALGKVGDELKGFYEMLYCKLSPP